jgi:hypothetical protein
MLLAFVLPAEMNEEERKKFDENLLRLFEGKRTQ